MGFVLKKRGGGVGGLKAEVGEILTLVTLGGLLSLNGREEEEGRRWWWEGLGEGGEGRRLQKLLTSRWRQHCV